MGETWWGVALSYALAGVGGAVVASAFWLSHSMAQKRKIARMAKYIKKDFKSELIVPPMNFSYPEEWDNG